MLLILPEYVALVVVDNISIGIGACKSSSTYTHSES